MSDSIVDELWMCDAILFNPLGMTSRSVAVAYWTVYQQKEQYKWRLNLNRIYN
jgi:hypothetical protein